MELDWSVDREGDASLVGVRVRNDGAVRRRVRIESRLDGPVLPPRRDGVPESGWDAEGVTAVIDSGDRAAFGFAALADPVDPPVELASVEPVTADPDDGHAATEDGSDLARTAVRDLESHRPPRGAVAGGPVSSTVDEEDSVAERGDGTDGSAVESEEGGGDADRSAVTDPAPSAAGPAEVDAWFAAVEARIERAERLADADLATATAVLEEAGGLDAVKGLDERVAANAERLRAVRDRAAALAERAEESDVPTEALEALA